MNRRVGKFFLLFILIVLLITTILFNQTQEIPEMRMLIEPLVIDEQVAACILEIESNGTLVATIGNANGYSDSLESKEYFQRVMEQKDKRLTRKECKKIKDLVGGVKEKGIIRSGTVGNDLLLLMIYVEGNMYSSSFWPTYTVSGYENDLAANDFAMQNLAYELLQMSPLKKRELKELKVKAKEQLEKNLECRKKYETEQRALEKALETRFAK